MKERFTFNVCGYSDGYGHVSAVGGDPSDPRSTLDRVVYEPSDQIPRPTAYSGQRPVDEIYGDADVAWHGGVDVAWHYGGAYDLRLLQLFED